MSYQKFQATQLFTGTEILESPFVLITDTKGSVDAIVEPAEAGDDIQHFAGTISPGFINCHCHLELSHMKGLIPEQTGLVDFVCKVITQRHFSEEEILDAIQKGEEEMLVHGIVAVGDICNNTLTFLQKQKNNLAYYNFVELSGWSPEIALKRFDIASQTYQQFSQLQAPGSRPLTSLSPHAPYSVSNKLWNLMQPHFTGKTITIHNQETAFEDELFISGKGDLTRMYEMLNLDISFFRPTGKSSLRSFLPGLQEAAQTILVHNTFTKEDDISYVAQEKVPVNWCLCINANQYIEKATPPVDMLRKHNSHIVLGTDSLASNHCLSIFDELKTIRNYFPHISLEEMLRWATINGAKALQMNDTLGSFEKGKTPGINLIQHLENGNIHRNSTVTRLL